MLTHPSPSPGNYCSTTVAQSAPFSPLPPFLPVTVMQLFRLSPTPHLSSQGGETRVSLRSSPQSASLRQCTFAASIFHCFRMRSGTGSSSACPPKLHGGAATHLNFPSSLHSSPWGMRGARGKLRGGKRGGGERGVQYYLRCVVTSPTPKISCASSHFS